MSLSASELTLFRGDRRLVHGLSFGVRPGEILLVEGANGSGKTSLLRAIAGLGLFASGSVTWRDTPIAGNRQAFLAETAWLAHKVGFSGDLSLLENLRFEMGLRGHASVDESVLEALDLLSIQNLPLRVLSAGQQRRVALARLLLTRATLWLLDEPFTNLDSAGQDLVTDLIDQHLDHKGLVVMAGHQAPELTHPMQRICLG